MDDKNEVVIITGGGTGVGAAAAKQLSKKETNLVINYSRSAQSAEETAQECRDMGAEVLVIQADVSNQDDCDRLVKKTLDKWGRIDGLMNNAGTSTFRDHDEFLEVTAAEFSRVYEVNVVGAFLMSRAVAAPMQKQKQGKGSIVNTSSVNGITGDGPSMAYGASKGALNTLTLSLARRLAPHVRVNAVAPGFITGRWQLERLGEEKYKEVVSYIEQTTPLQHAGTPEDIAETAVWLLTAARNITGEIIICDAGSHLGSGYS